MYASLVPHVSPVSSIFTGTLPMRQVSQGKMTQAEVYAESRAKASNTGESVANSEQEENCLFGEVMAGCCEGRGGNSEVWHARPVVMFMPQHLAGSQQCHTHQTLLLFSFLFLNPESTYHQKWENVKIKRTNSHYCMYGQRRNLLDQN